jgi:hypothetical protein
MLSCVPAGTRKVFVTRYTGATAPAYFHWALTGPEAVVVP